MSTERSDISVDQVAGHVASESLEAVVYLSSAVGQLTEDQLDELLHAAREKNLERRITGVLFHDEGNFMQYFEGPPEAVEALFASIERDPRHHNIIVLTRESRCGRVFPEWTMASRKTPFAERRKLQAALDDPDLQPGDPVSMVRFLWEQYAGG
ncbi:MAG: BLUF domain-containing protein [Gammaproteobacteria bacterium]